MNPYREQQLTNFNASETKSLHSHVSAMQDVQFTLELEADTEYVVYLDDVNVGDMKTNLSGKLSVSAELEPEAFDGS